MMRTTPPVIMPLDCDVFIRAQRCPPRRCLPGKTLEPRMHANARQWTQSLSVAEGHLPAGAKLPKARAWLVTYSRSLAFIRG